MQKWPDRHKFLPALPRPQAGPSASEAQPNGVEERRVLKLRRRLTSLATSDQPPATSDQPPATSDQPPATTHQRSHPPDFSAIPTTVRPIAIDAVAAGEGTL